MEKLKLDNCHFKEVLKQYESYISTSQQHAMIRVASGPGISGNLEKSGNFVALEKGQGKVREFRKIRKSQGILMQN